MASRAGFTVYEGGTNILNEPVLVYLGMSWRSSLEFKIFDHVDRIRGYAKHTRSLGSPGRTPCQVHDPWGSPLIQIRPRPAPYEASYQVEGVVSGVFFASPYGAWELVIMAHNEAIGYINGRASGGVGSSEMIAFDHDRNEVASLRWFFERSNLLRRTASCVVSIDPNLGGGLRRLLIATPIVVEATRQARRGTTMILPFALLVSE